MSYCPECGTSQPHVHLGWLDKETHHTQLHCGCGFTSIFVISKAGSKGAKLHAEITKAIRDVFGWIAC